MSGHGDVVPVEERRQELLDVFLRAADLGQRDQDQNPRPLRHPFPKVQVSRTDVSWRALTTRLRRFGRWAWLVPLVAVLGAAVGAATGAFASGRYRSETELV